MSRDENEERALRISRAAGLNYPDESDAATILRDVLTDARHFADREGLDYADADLMARNHHSAEQWEAQNG